MSPCVRTFVSWVAVRLRLCLSPCLCVDLCPFIQACVRALLCVICGCTPLCLYTCLWSGSVILPCVCICVSEQVEMGAPVLCRDPTATLYGLEDGNRNLCGCGPGPGPLRVDPVAQSLHWRWSAWRALATGPHCSRQDSGSWPRPCPHLLLTVPFSSSLPHPCLLSPAIPSLLSLPPCSGL